MVYRLLYDPLSCGEGVALSELKTNHSDYLHTFSLAKKAFFCISFPLSLMNSMDMAPPPAVVIDVAEIAREQEEIPEIAPRLTQEARAAIAAMIAVRKDGTPRLTWSRFR